MLETKGSNTHYFQRYFKSCDFEKTGKSIDTFGKWEVIDRRFWQEKKGDLSKVSMNNKEFYEMGTQKNRFLSRINREKNRKEYYLTCC